LLRFKRKIRTEKGWEKRMLKASLRAGDLKGDREKKKKSLSFHKSEERSSRRTRTSRGGDKDKGKRENYY